MGLMAFLEWAEEEICARASAATQETFDDVLGVLDSVCSFVSATRSFPSSAGVTSISLVPSQTASQDDAMIYTAEVFFEVDSRMQGPELIQAVSDDAVPAPLIICDDLTVSVQDLSEELPFLFSEQILCDTAVNASPFESSENPKKEEEVRDQIQDLCEAEVFVQNSSRACAPAEDLDMHCLVRMMSFLDNSSLQACSLVCQQWLEASNFARSDLKLQGCTSLENVRRLLTRFDRLSSLHIIDPDYALPPEKRSRQIAYSFCDRSMEVFAQRCTHLQELELIGSELLSDAGLAAILSGCQELRSLKIKHCSGFSGEGFSRYCSYKLERLDLDFCLGLSNKGLTEIADPFFTRRPFSFPLGAWTTWIFGNSARKRALHTAEGVTRLSRLYARSGSTCSIELEVRHSSKVPWIVPEGMKSRGKVVGMKSGLLGLIV